MRIVYKSLIVHSERRARRRLGYDTTVAADGKPSQALVDTNQLLDFVEGREFLE
jgi:hypothetical protein